MDIPFVNDSFSGSFDLFSDESFLSGDLPGFSSFTSDSGDIVDNILGGEFDIADIVPGFENVFQFSGSSGGSGFGDGFLNGDFSAIGDILDEYFGPVLQLISSVVPSFSSIEDLGQFDIQDDFMNFDIEGSSNNFSYPGSSALALHETPGESTPPSSAPHSISDRTDNVQRTNNSSITGPANGKYDALIEKYAEQYGVDPNVIKAIMAKESQGNPEAVSWAGAVGLMQVKPETASELLGRTVTADELKNNPELNIQVGVMYFAKMMKEKGNTEDALGAYNQGPNANWRSIPESVDYVDSIMTSLENGTLPSWG
jgi:hypothetical protein